MWIFRAFCRSNVLWHTPHLQRMSQLEIERKIRSQHSLESSRIHMVFDVVHDVEASLHLSVAKGTDQVSLYAVLAHTGIFFEMLRRNYVFEVSSLDQNEMKTH
jgi:hypothetical protein